MKKTLSFILAFIMVLSMCVSVSSSALDEHYIPFIDGFYDVRPEQWFYEDVTWCVGNGVLHGYPGQMFKPYEKLTRAQFAKILYGMSGVTESYEDVELPFNDVKKAAWYTESIRWAYKKGIIKGKSDESFAPDAPVTRAELATMVFRYIDKEQLATEYVHSDELAPDYDSIPGYAKLAAVFLYRAGLLKGKQGGAFDPNGMTTRAETASLLRRMVTTVKKQDMSLVENHGLSLYSFAYINMMPQFTINGAAIPVSQFYIVGVDLIPIPGSEISSDIKVAIDLKISPFSGTVEAETVFYGDGIRSFRVEDEETLLALNMSINSFLVLEYTVTINGESADYMSYITVDAAY